MKKQMKNIVKNRMMRMSDIKIRDIVESDIENGFLESLDSLKPASNLEREIAIDILKKIIEILIT